MNHNTDWANRWLGGFCAVGALGGLPVRGPDYAAHPPLDQILTLPPRFTATLADQQAVDTAWANVINSPVVLLANADRARTLLLRALGVQPDEAIGLPSNATRELTEAIKHYPARPHWIDLGEELQFLNQPARLSTIRFLWAQPSGGAGVAIAPKGVSLLVDASDSLPDLVSVRDSGAVATIYGLHLTTDQRTAGALVVCHNVALANALTALAHPEDFPNPTLAMAQLDRLAAPTGVAARQRAALTATRQALQQAAGLPLIATTPGVLAQHIALWIPEPCDAATFYAYVLGEHTPIRWLPTLRPLHYAALRADGAPSAKVTAEHIARVLLVPVGPDFSDEEIKHCVLGVTKAADYLGVRWATDPERAAWYATLMIEWYGADHDAFRPLEVIERARIVG